MKRQRRERFPAVVTGIIDRPKGLINLILQDERFPVDFGPNGRITGIPPNVFLGPQIQGYSRGRQPGDYDNFGEGGITINTKVWAYCPRGDYDVITYLSPRDDEEEAA